MSSPLNGPMREHFVPILDMTTKSCEILTAEFLDQMKYPSIKNKLEKMAAEDITIDHCFRCFYLVRGDEWLDGLLTQLKSSGVPSHVLKSLDRLIKDGAEIYSREMLENEDYQAWLAERECGR